MLLNEKINVTKQYSMKLKTLKQSKGSYWAVGRIIYESLSIRPLVNRYSPGIKVFQQLCILRCNICQRHQHS